jgi:erythromycin esterase-like protein
MGRTVPSFRMVLDSIIMELVDFRRTLRRRDREAFDRIMDMAREHASASAVAATIDPMDTIVLSILIEQQKQIDDLKEDQDAASP